MSAPGEGGFAGSTNMSFGSTSKFQIATNAFFGSRFFSVTFTFASGIGKRSDSWKVRLTLFASSVASHSP